jgi:hypothetical protein
MDLIKQFMKIGGFKTPEELEKFGEVEFFNKHPEARELAKKAMGGTPEAFNMTMPADKFFSYGVPVPPTYLQKGGISKRNAIPFLENEAANIVYDKMTRGYNTDVYDEFAHAYKGLPDEVKRAENVQNPVNKDWSYGSQVYDPGSFANYINDKLGREAVTPLMKPWSGPYDVTGRTPNFKNLPDKMEPLENDFDSGIDYKTLTPSYPREYSNESNVMNKGGSLTNRMVYPQIQSADQFFSPVYTDSHNAYAKGGNIEEFPQAVSYPQHGWGATNYFMLQDGGTFPPGMPQYTGMLPVMQTGSGLSGIMSKTIENSDHYGVPTFQEGGMSNDEPDQSFYANKMNKFMNSIRGTAYQKMSEDLMSSANPYMEEMPEPGAKYGGYPLKKAQDGSAGIGPRVGNVPVVPVQTGPTPNLGDPQAAAMMDRASQLYRDLNTPDPARDQKILQQRQDADVKKNAQDMGWGNDVQGYIDSNFQFGPGKSVYKKEEKPKKSTKTQAGVSRTVDPGTTKTVTAPAPAGSTTPAPAATTTNGNTTTTPVTTSTTPAAPAATTDWIEVTDDKGRKGWKNPKDGQIYYPNAADTSTTTTTQQNPTWNYDPMWLMPGRYRPGRITRGMDAYLEALAAGQIARGDVRVEKIRNRLIPGTGVRYMTFRTPDQTISGQTPGAQAPTIKDPGKKPDLPAVDKTWMPPMLMPPDTGNNTPWIPQVLQSAPTSSPNANSGTTFSRTNTAQMKDMMEYILNQKAYGGSFLLPGYQPGGSILDENPFGGTEIMTQPNPEQNMYWNTGNMDQMNQVARQIEKDSPLGKVYEMNLEKDEVKKGKKFKYKPGRNQGPSLGPDAIMAMMSAGTNLMNKMPWNQDNQDFNSALSTYGMPRKPTNRGSYLTNDPGMGNTFRPDQYNPNMRGFYAPDYGYAQTGGQQFANMDGDQYYLTQEQINKVIKAGGRVPGF